MLEVLYENDNFIISYNEKVNHGKVKSKYILTNKFGGYKNHGHFKKLSTCKKLIEIMEKGQVPDSYFLQESIIRITNDIDYIFKIKRKQEKNRNKLKYYNVNKGVSKKYKKGVRR